MVKNEKLTPDKTRKEKDPWKFSFQNRFTLKKDSIFKTHARLRKDFEYEHIINTFAIDGAWSDETKWETNGELVTNTHVTKKWALSFGNFARWGLTDHKVTSQHGPSSSYMLSDKEVLSLSYTANLAFIDNVWWADSYSISGGYRLSAWHNVLYASVNPFLNYARSNGFRQDPGISAALEAVF
ncbi:MAG: hypothetical protein KDD38_08785 [Bdellovibrionales bacterium]|nr:hypothetical protein [Bdellovibrionales bacterium]